MPHEFELREEFELVATPEQVWEAIATGPGIDSWFMGRNQVDPGEGGAVRTTFGDYTPATLVTAWEPGKRFAYRGDEGEDGRFVAYEFLIEGRAKGTTVLRTVTSGFLPGDDWEDEYEAMTLGFALFFHTLVEYLTYFRGRTATPVTAFGPLIADWPRAWATLNSALGLGGTVAEGDRVRFTPEGLAPIEGVVYFINEHNLGVRADDALYRFLRGFTGPMIAGHHLFAGGVDPKRAEDAWQAWLNRVLI
jgi:uncharacterized protein YndB with AHSA1/START domain